MKLCVASPYPLNSLKGNSVTAKRTVDLLVAAGVDARASCGFDGDDADILIALHAVKGAGAVRDYRAAFPDGIVIVLITGTDLYQDLPAGAKGGRETLEASDAIVVVGEIMIKSLPPKIQEKAVVVPKSLDEITIPRMPSGSMTLSVIGHLRPVKRPFMTIEAIARNPHWRVEVNQVGEALTDECAAEAELWQEKDRRYRWLRGLPREESLRICAASDLTINTSELEGGPNAILEAMMIGVPVLASDIDGNRLLLGDDYPGYFQEGELEQCLREFVTGGVDVVRWRQMVQHRASLFTAKRETSCWLELIEKLTKDPRATENHE